MLKTKKNSKNPKKTPSVLKLAMGCSLGLAAILPSAVYSMEETALQEAVLQEAVLQEEPQPLKLAEHQTPQWAERYILKHHPRLLENSKTDHVLAFYYFGSYQDFTIFGMERVKGSDYLSHNTVLVFNDSQLQGYYQELTVFPAGVSSEGEVFFPPNYQALQNIDLQSGDYPEIQFKPDLERFKRGDLERPPQKFSYIKIKN